MLWNTFPLLVVKFNKNKTLQQEFVHVVILFRK